MVEQKRKCHLQPSPAPSQSGRWESERGRSCRVGAGGGNLWDPGRLWGGFLGFLGHPTWFPRDQTMPWAHWCRGLMVVGPARGHNPHHRAVPSGNCAPGGALPLFLPSFPRVSSGAVAEGESPARAVPGPALCPRSPAVPRGHWGSVSAPAAAPGGGAGGAAAARDWSWDGDVPAEPAQERERKVWKLQEVPAQHSWLLLARRSATDRTHTLCVTWGTFHPPALDTEPWR